MPKLSKTWEVPGGTPDSAESRPDTMGHNKAPLQEGEAVGSYHGNIGSPSIQTTESPNSLPGD